jgi:hypothetical protein
MMPCRQHFSKYLLVRCHGELGSPQSEAGFPITGENDNLLNEDFSKDKCRRRKELVNEPQDSELAVANMD